MKLFALLLSLLLSVPAMAFSVTRSCIADELIENAAVTAAASVQLVGRNDNRHCLLIVNKGSQIVYITFVAGGGATEGIPIPSGGNYEPVTPLINSIYARSASGTQTVLVMQGH